MENHQYTRAVAAFATLSFICCFCVLLFYKYSFHLSYLQPVGSDIQSVVEDIIVLNHLPSPNEFWTEYIITSKPALFHNSVKLLPAFNLWNDDYLSLNYGHMEVIVETQRKENRNAKPISMLLSEFLRLYLTEDLYMITVVDSEWLSDISMPKLLQCGNLQKSFSHINLWMSNGGTKSVLHRDAMDNIHCVIDGTKEILLINKTMEEKVHVNREGYNDIGVEWIDMPHTYRVWEVPLYNVTVNAGDCIFIPYMWFHQVKSSNVRNLSLNWWMNHLLWFNATDCENKNLEDWISSENFHFPTLKEKEHFQLIQMIDGKHSFTTEEFLNSFQEMMCKNANLKQLFMLLDQNQNGVITLEELYGADSVLFTSYFVNCSFNHDEL